MQWGLLPNGKAQNDGVVVGVVGDFHTHSLHNKIEPLAIQYVQTKFFFSVKLKSRNDNTEEVIKLKAFWQEQLGNRIMETFFLDENFNQQYKAEEKVLKVFNYFTIISLILSSLGLFALTSFMIKQKIKEIKIRKLLGASLYSIILILSRDFLILMIVGLLFAIIPTFYFINQWLNDFPYHISIHFFPVLVAVLITFTIVMLVVSFSTVKVTNTKLVIKSHS